MKKKFGLTTKEMKAQVKTFARRDAKLVRMVTADYAVSTAASSINASAAPSYTFTTVSAPSNSPSVIFVNPEDPYTEVDCEDIITSYDEDDETEDADSLDRLDESDPPSDADDLLKKIYERVCQMDRKLSAVSREMTDATMAIRQLEAGLTRVSDTATELKEAVDGMARAVNGTKVEPLADFPLVNEAALNQLLEKLRTPNGIQHLKQSFKLPGPGEKDRIKLFRAYFKDAVLNLYNKSGKNGRRSFMVCPIFNALKSKWLTFDFTSLDFETFVHEQLERQQDRRRTAANKKRKLAEAMEEAA